MKSSSVADGPANVMYFLEKLIEPIRDRLLLAE